MCIYAYTCTQKVENAIIFHTGDGVQTFDGCVPCSSFVVKFGTPPSRFKCILMDYAKINSFHYTFEKLNCGSEVAFFQSLSKIRIVWGWKWVVEEIYYENCFTLKYANSVVVLTRQLDVALTQLLAESPQKDVQSWCLSVQKLGHEWCFRWYPRWTPRALRTVT